MTLMVMWPLQLSNLKIKENENPIQELKMIIPASFCTVGVSSFLCFGAVKDFLKRKQCTIPVSQDRL